MDITLNPSSLSGTVSAIPSKSHVHRLLICAALADAPSTVGLVGSSADIDATVACLTALGAEIVRGEASLCVTPIKNRGADAALNCGESGSTLRFLLPVAAALGGNTSFTGGGRLPERPLQPLVDQLILHGAEISDDHIPLTVSGKLEGGRFSLPGDISSQYITGLMMALPIVGGGEIEITTPLQSKGYVDMTVSVLKQFGVEVTQSGNIYTVPGGGYTASEFITAEGDWSNAAPWLCAGAIHGSITVTGLDPDSIQGDKAVLDVLKGFGAEVIVDGTSVTVTHRPLRGTVIDASDIPDLIPYLSVAAAAAEGETKVINAARLRIKESDRLAAIRENLQALGADVTETEDSLTVRGGVRLKGAKISGHNDHRMVMSAAISTLITDGDITVSDKDAVNKSYPRFFEDFAVLGGKTNV